MRKNTDGPRGVHNQFERTLTTVERDTEAARLRDEERLTYREIAERLGFASPGSAHHAAQRAIRSVPVAVVKTLRAREFARLEYLWEALQEGIDAGDVQAVTEGRKISESLRRLFALDGAVEPEGDDEKEASEIAKMLADADAFLKAEQAKIYRSGSGNAD